MYHCAAGWAEEVTDSLVTRLPFRNLEMDGESASSSNTMFAGIDESQATGMITKITINMVQEDARAQ